MVPKAKGLRATSDNFGATNLHDARVIRYNLYIVSKNNCKSISNHEIPYNTVKLEYLQPKRPFELSRSKTNFKISDG